MTWGTPKTLGALESPGAPSLRGLLGLRIRGFKSFKWFWCVAKFENHVSNHLLSLFSFYLFSWEREGGRESQADSFLSTEPHWELDPRTLRSWPELKSRVSHSANSATQTPFFFPFKIIHFLKIKWTMKKNNSDDHVSSNKKEEHPLEHLRPCTALTRLHCRWWWAAGPQAPTDSLTLAEGLSGVSQIFLLATTSTWLRMSMWSRI